MKENVRSYLGELVGTFALVFIGTSVATLQGFLPGYGDTGWLGISFAFGFTLMVLVWVIGPVSGCHINPAVTIAMLIARKIEGGKAMVYIIAQVVGALVASLVLLAIVGGIPGYELGSNGLGANGNPRQMGAFSLLLLELVMTALFLVVILGATRDDATPGVAGMAIGGYLFVAHLVGAQLGDASLNPARSLGPALVQGGAALASVWIFIVGPIVGAILGSRASATLFCRYEFHVTSPAPERHSGEGRPAPSAGAGPTPGPRRAGHQPIMTNGPPGNPGQKPDMIASPGGL